jgi:hypothetical protein
MPSAFNPNRFDNIKFRASSIDTLMTGAWDDPLTEAQQKEYNDWSLRTKPLTVRQQEKYDGYQARLDSPKKLSATTLGALKKIARKEIYNIDIELTGKQLDRGTNYEQASIDLLNSVAKQKYVKNEQLFENMLFKGTPDIISNYIVDIKTCYDFNIFLDKNENDASTYMYQLMTYDRLVGLNKAKGYIVYACPSWTDYDIEHLVKTSHSDPDQHYLNYNYDRIPAQERVKIIEVKFDTIIKNGDKSFMHPDIVWDKVKTQTKEWKNYLNLC